MKKTIELLMIALLAAGMVACESLKLGDEGLSKAPESSGATLDTLFASLKDADKVLAEAYYYLPYGLLSSFDSKLGNDILESITDHYISNKHSDGNGPNDLYYTGGLNANHEEISSAAYQFGNEKDYYAIRYGWLFLENADKIPDADATQLARKKAEAKLIIAIAYANMFRYVVGVPILDHAVQTDEEMNYPRETFAKTVDYIVGLCDEAAKDLPWYVSAAEDGRLTKAAALGLKLRVLCFAASPTFNSDTKWHPQANDYTCYGNYDKARWERAKAAADEFMSAWGTGGYYQLVQATPTGVDPVTNQTYATPRDYRLAYRKGYYNRGSSECIISTRKSNSTSYHDKHIDLQDDFGCGASLDWVNKFPWADGTPFPADFNWEKPEKQPFFEPDPTGVIKIPGIETRDPRLYENVCVPGDVWKDGTVGKAYDNHWSHQDGCPGFLMMKYILQQKTDRNVPPHWCLMRLAEVLLNAAEAYNEANGGPDAQAYAWVDAVRARVGLPGLAPEMTQEQFRKALILERELEFGFEEVRWFDMVRWGLKEAFTTKLSGLTSIGDKQREATSFKFSVKEAYPPRAWYTSFDTKWYLSPIPAVEIQKGYGMTQNPGW